MKQHITVEQLKEIDIKLLCETFGFMDMYEKFNPKHEESIYHKNYIIYLSHQVTIGKMIEILESQALCNGIELFLECKMHSDGWVFVLSQYYECKGKRCSHAFMIYITKETDRCDALWQAVKEIL